MPGPTKNYKYVSLGQHLKDEIVKKYGDIKKFSEVCGIPAQTLSTYVVGRSFPPVDKFVIICKLLDKTPSFLLSPALDISPRDKDLLEMFAKLKEFYKDADAWRLIRTLFLGLEIYNVEKKESEEKDIINILESIKLRLIKKKL